jgi:hypothetical protein
MVEVKSEPLKVSVQCCDIATKVSVYVKETPENWNQLTMN